MVMHFALIFVCTISFSCASSKGSIFGFYEYQDKATGVFVTDLNTGVTSHVANLTVPSTVTVSSEVAACVADNGVIWTVGESGHYGHGNVTHTLKAYWITFDTHSHLTSYHFSQVMTSETGTAVTCSKVGDGLMIATRRAGIDPSTAQCRFGRVTFDSEFKDSFHEIPGTNFSCVDGVMVVGSSDYGSHVISLAYNNPYKPSVIKSVDFQTNSIQIVKSQQKQISSFVVVKDVIFAFTADAETNPVEPPEFMFGRFTSEGVFKQIGHVDGMYLPPIFPTFRAHAGSGSSYYMLMSNSTTPNNPDGFLLYDWSMVSGNFTVLRLGNDLTDYNEYSVFVWMK